MTADARPVPPALARTPKLPPETIEALRPHIVNLNQGAFSTRGAFTTSQADVDRLFDEHLPAALRASNDEGRPFHLLFYAHGGLIDEASGLEIASLQVDWWKRNGVYPVHFVWETGFLDALGQLLSGVRAVAPRDVWDYTTDLLVEGTARALGGEKIWSAMKRSAELASAAAGGARYVARRLAAFCRDHGEVQVHAAGHSAGSIFHAHFLPAAFEEGLAGVRTFALLAPAIRSDEFKRHLLPHLGTRIASTTMFTMSRAYEEDDDVARVYRKSLLYLIYYALEPERETDILGLEISLRSDQELARAFSLGAGARGPGEVVWSVTRETSGRSASTSRTHGGFDNDGPTMMSALRRMVDRDEIVAFPREATDRARRALQREAIAATTAVSVALPAGAGAMLAPGPLDRRKRALCVGIDRYPSAPLAGCVADAREWAGTLESLGFTTTLMLDEEATRANILEALRSLITSSQPGDVVVFQFAGHGTELEDLDGDEAGGTNGPRDEAFCPFDFDDGAFLIDDDIAVVFRDIPPGVNVTCFVDCCHSGTITRALVGPAPARATPTRRARFLRATPEMERRHREFREAGRGGSTASAGVRDPELMPQVVFSACRDYEVAYEQDGHGEFTLRATRLLRGGVTNVTHEAFQELVTREFGPRPQQHPDLDCSTAARTRVLFGPLAGAPGEAIRVTGVAGAAPPASHAAVAGVLRAVATLLEGQ